MYNTKYQIFFRSINNELFTIQIKENGYTGSITELTGGVSPFLINYDSESEFLYNPLRFSGGTLKVVGSDYLQSLFSTNYQQYKVNLLDKSNKILWTGYITPELYSQEYSGFNFELEIECISALSTLEYFKFEKKTETISLFQLIKDSVNKANGDYSNIYIPCVYGYKATEVNVLDSLSVASNNFIDEEGEAMTYKSILEEICRFLGWTMTERDGDIYFIDVDYIKNNNNQYFKYNYNLTSVSVVTLSTDKLNIQEIGSEGIENSLSIIGGFNKINVIASDYEVDNNMLYPELELTNNLIADITKEKDNKRYVNKYYTSSSHSLSIYDLVNNIYIKSNEPVFDNIGRQRAGAVAYASTSYSLDDIPNKPSYTNMIMIKQRTELVDTNKYLYESSDAVTVEKYPVIKTMTSSNGIVYDYFIKLAINFNLFLLCSSDDGIIYDNVFKTGGNNNWNDDNIYVLAKLRIGNNYYDGKSWNTDSSTYFKLYTDCSRDKVIGDWLNARDTNNESLRVPDLNGTIIHFDNVISGDLELTLYNPRIVNTKTGEPEKFFPVQYFIIKNIEINAQRMNFDDSINTKKDSSKKDTLYTNVVNESFINEADDIELKLTSKNNSELSYSKITYGSGLLDTITNKITNTEMKPEKLIINRVINQYKQPKLKLLQILKPDVTPYQLLTDNKLINKDFIIINENIDYYNDTDEITMLEVN